MNFDISAVAQVIGTLTPLFVFVYTLHRQNQAKQEETSKQIIELIGRVKKHDKRTRKMKASFTQHVAEYHSRRKPNNVRSNRISQS